MFIGCNMAPITPINTGTPSNTVPRAVIKFSDFIENDFLKYLAVCCLIGSVGYSCVCYYNHAHNIRRRYGNGTVALLLVTNGLIGACVGFLFAVGWPLLLIFGVIPGVTRVIKTYEQ